MKTKRIGRPPLKKGEGKDAIVTMRFRSTEAEKLRRLAEKQGVSLSKLIRDSALSLLDELTSTP